ncbi:hypothetical protein Ancab_029863 [Ancistrocladus abbreviatus]
MEPDVDHYQVLGLPSGEEGANLKIEDITKAYKLKALKLHPDKNPDDPDAAANFQKLRSSYDVLSNEKTRKLFDDLLRIKREKKVRQTQYDVKRQKMMSDLEKREKEAFTPDPVAKAREEEERIKKKLQEEIAKIRAMHANRGGGFAAAMEETTGKGGESLGADGGSGAVDKEKVLKVTWDKVGGGDYSAEGLRELFGKFGEVEDVVIRSSKKKGSALVVMASKEAAVAAMGIVSGDISNPLLVLPLKPAATTIHSSPSAQRPEEPEGPAVGNLVGAGYQAFENSVLEKLRKAAQKQK